MVLGLFYSNAFALELVCCYALGFSFYTRLLFQCAFLVMWLGV